MLRGSKLNMKTKRELRKPPAEICPPRLGLPVRAADPLAMAFCVLTNTQTKKTHDTMKTIRIITLATIVAASSFVSIADAEPKEGAKDIVAVASGNGSFNTLVAAVKAAGLVETLQGSGPFTVFAPTDEAFAKLPKGTVEDLLKPENKAKLVSILTYHVVPAKAMAKDVAGMDKAKTVNGKELKLSAKDGNVKVDDATVTQADIPASNGVIHVIDTVLMP